VLIGVPVEGLLFPNTLVTSCKPQFVLGFTPFGEQNARTRRHTCRQLTVGRAPEGYGIPRISASFWAWLTLNKGDDSQI